MRQRKSGVERPDPLWDRVMKSSCCGVGCFTRTIRLIQPEAPAVDMATWPVCSKCFKRSGEVRIKDIRFDLAMVRDFETLGGDLLEAAPQGLRPVTRIPRGRLWNLSQSQTSDYPNEEEQEDSLPLEAGA